MAFTYKGYGRIYTNPGNIQKVENIIKELNEFEWDYYYPKDLVASLEEYPNVVYVGKFEFDEDLFKQICKEKNIPVLVFDSGDDGFPDGLIKCCTKEEIKSLFFLGTTHD